MSSTQQLPMYEEEVRRQLAEERARLFTESGIEQKPVEHFRKPVENRFTAAERDKVTILFGGMTWKHDSLMGAVMSGAGYKCQHLPVPDVPAFQLGKQYGNNGQCNPTYFTVGNLVQYLQGLEKEGMSRKDIVDNYIFFTAGACGPCRFGMYEAEFRLALRNSGFDGFRVLLFQQDDGINASSGEAGLTFTVDFGMGMLNALNLGDITSDVSYQIRPYEVNSGETDRVFEEALDELRTTLREREHFEILKVTPPWLARRLKKYSWHHFLNSMGKVREHLYGTAYLEAMKNFREKMNSIEVDRLRVKPKVKITGEFWAQITEGDGNFNMFRFLEREGAQAMVEPVGTWVMYLLHNVKMQKTGRKEIDAPHTRPKWWQLSKRLANWFHFEKNMLLLTIGEKIWAAQYRRVIKGLGGITHDLVSQDELDRLAHPFYHKLARGGEGFLEVGKNIYYTTNKLCHMVISLKPFGCMPSSQSDGVQSAVVNRFKDMTFLAVETSGEGEINAHSRVQMALGEAKAKAKAEFQEVLESTGKRLEDIKAYVADHPELRRPFYHVPHKRGVTGDAANFVLHVSSLIDRENRWSWLPALRRASA